MDAVLSSFPGGAEAALALAYNIGLAILILFVGWIASKWANRIVMRAVSARQYDQALGRFLGSIFQYTVLAAAVIASLGAVGIETTSLVAVLASAGLAVGLALQGSLSNFASGVMILIFRPFDLEDVVSAGGSTGKVIEIGLLATTLHTPDNQKVIVPNSSVMGGTITNITTLGTRRGAVDVGVAYGEDIDRIVAILERAAASAPAVLSDPAPAVAFTGMGASSIDFTILTWSRSADYLAMLHQVRSRAYAALNQAGIDIPYPQMVMHNASESEAVAAK